MEKKPTATYKVKLSVISPITIGSGEKLSPYSDYVIDNGFVYIINKNELLNKILLNDNLMEVYIEGISKEMDNNRSNFDLKNFIENSLKESIEDVTLIKYPLLTNNTQQKLPIVSIIKTPFSEPYIPGSSIKGAIKTAIIYDWLNRINKEDTDNSMQMKYIDNLLSIDSAYDRHKRNRAVTDLLKDITESSIKNIETFNVTDSKPIDKEEVVVVDCKRKMPLRFECISPKTQTEFEIEIDKSISWEELAHLINRYSYNTLSHNMDVVDELGNADNTYLDKLEELETTLDKLTDNTRSQIAYLRLGFGKGFYFNSVSLAIYDWVKDDSYKKDQFKRFLSRTYPKLKELENFPSTYLKTDNTNEPLGWVKIEKI